MNVRPEWRNAGSLRCVSFNPLQFSSLLYPLFPKNLTSSAERGVSCSSYSYTFKSTPGQIKMDAYSISYTLPSRRGSSRVYKDLAACLSYGRSAENENIEDFVMDAAKKVSKQALLQTHFASCTSATPSSLLEKKVF